MQTFVARKHEMTTVTVACVNNGHWLPLTEHEAQKSQTTAVLLQVVK